MLANVSPVTCDICNICNKEGRRPSDGELDNWRLQFSSELHTLQTRVYADFWTPLWSRNLRPRPRNTFHNFSCAGVMDRPDVLFFFSLLDPNFDKQPRRDHTAVDWSLFAAHLVIDNKSSPCKFFFFNLSRMYDDASWRLTRIVMEFSISATKWHLRLSSWGNKPCR